MRIPLSPQDRIIVPLDLADREEAKRIVSELAQHVGGFKVGYQLGYNMGWSAAAELVTAEGAKVFLDPKLNDIPNTMAQGATALCGLNPWMLTLHASAGINGMRAVVEKKGSTLILAVTVLTSFSEADSQRVFGMSSQEKVKQFAIDAAKAGVDGLVCSPKELDVLSEEENLSKVLRVTPGVRPVWAAADDQARVTTPAEAVAAGADYLVIGRPITRPPGSIGSPAEAAKRIVDEIAEVTPDGIASAGIGR
jgi:orotidine-5'-phosphate decarboxylase